MSWENSVQVVDLVLGSLLIGKLWNSGLYRQYPAFWLFLIVDLLGSYGWLISRVDPHHLDYRVVWLCTSIPVWGLTLSMVYRHMEKILINLPGIARLSRTVLNVAYALAVGCGILTTYLQYGNRGLSESDKFINYLLALGIILAGTFATIALCVFLAMLTFLIWFPVSVPRNVASLTAGLLLYFTAKTVLLLARSAWSHESVRLISLGITIVSTICFAFWVMFITPEGENSVSKLQLPWRDADKERLIRQLEVLDQSLVHAARR
ncbi:MAG: hypothetical protein ACJ746_31995 [Bryobacteraceae bacterium]